MPERLTVHLIDDDPDLRDSVMMMLESSGYHAICYPSGQEFLNSVLKTLPGCAIIDMKMPGMDGLELQAALKQQGNQVPVIFMTGHGEIQTAVESMKAGALDFVEKPCSMDRLKEAIERAFAIVRQVNGTELENGEARRRISRLTQRETDVLECLVAGDANKVVAYKLGISARTVEIHRANLMGKLQVRSLPELVRLALAANIQPRLV